MEEHEQAVAFRELLGHLRLKRIKPGTDPHSAMLFVVSAFDHLLSALRQRDETINRLRAELQQQPARLGTGEEDGPSQWESDFLCDTDCTRPD